MLDVTASTGPLAKAAARLCRLLPARAGVLLRGDRAALRLAASDGELSAWFEVPAGVAGAGEVVVARRGLAETLAGLDAPEVRLAVEGSRLAVRVPGARFALPTMGGSVPPPTRVPEPAGEVDGAALRAAAVTVAGAASREPALPIFTGVRVRSAGDRLALLATDRYQLASASVPWRAVGAVDLLVPAPVLAEAARQAGRAETVVVRADADLFGLTWPGGGVVSATLGGAYPDVHLDRLLEVRPECVVEADADALAGAVERAARYGGEHGRVTVQVGDGALVIRASDPLAGEAEETVKAAVQGDHVTRCYQARLVLDALRPFGGHGVVLRIQPDLRATEFTGPAAEELRYLVVPMRVA